MTEPHGLRERKKQQTRELIADTARRLFLERGFEAVTVAEIAREADVAEKTVFNYFPTKEDLFYSRMESFEEELLGAIRERRPGETVLAAFGRFVLEPRGVLAKQQPGEARATGERLKRITRTITNSPALVAREHQVFERYTTALANLIAEETRAGADDIEPWVVANALMGVHRALIDYVRQRTLGDAAVKELARDVRAQGKKALASLEAGLGDYEVKQPAVPDASPNARRRRTR